MNSAEKITILNDLLAAKTAQDDIYYDTLKRMGDLKQNYGDYLITEPIDCNRELRRLDGADYDLCCALLTMLLREDHFDNGSLCQRYEAGEIQPIIERMILLLSETA